MSETPTNNQLNNWYDKALEIPSFLDTLSLYQKDELRIFTQKKVVKNYSFAVECFSIWKEENYPKGLPREKRIEHILFFNLDTKKPIFVLNLIGWNWTPEKSFYKIEEPQLHSKEIDIIKNNSNKNYYKKEVALIFVLNQKHLFNPVSDQSDTLKNILSDYLEVINSTTPKTVYDYYRSISMAISNERTPKKQVESISQTLNISNTRLNNYLKNILIELNLIGKGTAEQYLKELVYLIN